MTFLAELLELKISVRFPVVTAPNLMARQAQGVAVLRVKACILPAPAEIMRTLENVRRGSESCSAPLTRPVVPGSDV